MRSTSGMLGRCFQFWFSFDYRRIIMNETDIKNISYYAGQAIVHVDVLSKYSRLGATETCRLVELEELISKIADICYNSLINEENQNSALAELHEWFVNNGSGIDWREQDKFEEIYKRLAACPNGENNKQSLPLLCDKKDCFHYKRHIWKCEKCCHCRKDNYQGVAQQ